MKQPRRVLIGLLAAVLLPLAGMQAASAATPSFFGDGVAVNLSAPDRTAGVATWSPDGRYMVFSSLLTGASDQREMWVMELPDGAPVRLHDPVAPGDFGSITAYFTPDSSKIVFRADLGDGQSWYVTTPAGGVPLKILSGATSFVPTLSEDSQYIVNPSPSVITSTPLAGGPSVVLATGTAGSRSGTNRMLYRQSGILYSIPYTGGTPTQLSVPGQSVHLYFDSDVATATVSYFATNPGETGYSLYQVPETGGTAVRIAGPGIDNVQPAAINIQPYHQSSRGWSYTTIVGGVTSISLYDPLSLTGGELTLPPGAASSFRQSPVFSQNNEYAVVVTDTAMFGARVDGTVATVFTNAPNSSRIAVSNDGHVAFLESFPGPVKVGQIGTPGSSVVHNDSLYFGRFSRDSTTLALYSPSNEGAVIDMATGTIVDLQTEGRIEFSYDSKYAFYGLDGEPDLLRSILYDVDAPVLAVTPDVTAEAVSAAGATVSYPTPAASDPSDPAPASVDCLPASGSVFALGDTTVTCSATDTSGNMAMSSFLVTVEDNGDPTIASVGDITAEATGAAGTAVPFSPPTAIDAVDPAVAVSCTSPPLFGGLYPLGTTVVTCTATDASGNTDSTTFNVNVVDTTDPVIGSVVDVVAEATGPSGTAVAFTPPTATDTVDTSVAVSCTAPPLFGGLYPLGTTAVTCAATDASGNTDSTTFNVTVVDTTGPSVTVPGTIVTDATSVDGAVVSFPASASDLVDGALVPTCTPASGSLFAVGTTTVTCEAQDAEGNVGAASFDVIVNAVGLPDIIDQITDAAGGASPGVAHDLNKAIDDITKALDALDETPPDVVKAIHELGKATKDIGKAVAVGFSAAEAAALNAAIADIALGLAQAEVDAAIARGGNQGDIDNALDHMADGLAELADDEWEQAIKDFAAAAEDALIA